MVCTPKSCRSALISSQSTKSNRTFQLDACVIVSGAAQARGGSVINGRGKTRTTTHSDKKSGQRLHSCTQTGVHKTKLSQTPRPFATLGHRAHDRTGRPRCDGQSVPSGHATCAHVACGSCRHSPLNPRTTPRRIHVRTVTESDSFPEPGP